MMMQDESSYTLTRYAKMFECRRKFGSRHEILDSLTNAGCFFSSLLV